MVYTDLGNHVLLNPSPNGNAEISGINFNDPYRIDEVNYTYCVTVNQLTGLPVLIHAYSFVNLSTTGFNYMLRFGGNGGVAWNCSFATKSDAAGAPAGPGMEPDEATYGNPVVPMDGIGDVSDPIYIWSNSETETSDPGYVGLNQFGPDECGNGERIENFLKEGTKPIAGGFRLRRQMQAFLRSITFTIGSKRVFPKPSGNVPNVRGKGQLR